MTDSCERDTIGLRICSEGKFSARPHECKSTSALILVEQLLGDVFDSHVTNVAFQKLGNLRTGFRLHKGVRVLVLGASDLVLTSVLNWFRDSEPERSRIQL